MGKKVKVFIGLDSNLEQPIEQVKTAINNIKLLDNCEFIAQSHLYSNPPLPSKIAQDDFINAVVAIYTTLDADTLLQQLQKIEDAQGRVRSNERWGPRTIDCDILLYGNEIIATENLTIPHYDLKNRNFYLFPMADIDKELILPDGTRFVDILKQHSDENLTKVS